MKFIYLFCFFLSILRSCKETVSDPELSANSVILALKAQGVMCSEGVTDIEWYTAQSKAPILKGLDVLHYPITTNSA